MNNKIVSEILFDLAGLTPDWIDEKYSNLYTRWKFDNSDDVWLDGRLLDKAEKRMIKISLYNIKPTPMEIIVSEKKAGFTLTEKMFIDKMISKLSKFTDADYPDDTWQMRINLFMDYLKKKQQQTNMNNYEIEPIESIQQKVDAIPAISDKIIYLIEYRADFIMKYNPVDVPKPEDPRRWHIQSYTFILLKQIETLIEKYEQLMKYQTVTPAPSPDNQLICDKKLLQKLHADFDGTIWERVELETFLNFMRVEPIEKIKPIVDNKEFAKWLRANIENMRDSKLVPNMNKWFIKLIGKNINYSTQFRDY